MSIDRIIALCCVVGAYLIGVYIGDFSIVMYHMLSLLIILEIVNMVYEYITKENHRLMIRYVVDASIIFVLRELMILITKHDMVFVQLLFQTLLYIGIVFALLSVRYICIKFSVEKLTAS